MHTISSQEEYSREHTSHEVNTELAEQQQKLELVMEANPGAIEQYERRKAEVCLWPWILGYLLAYFNRAD